MILIRYSEIGLKGDNRSFFEQQLVRNIEACLHDHAVVFEKVERVFGRILVQTNDSCTCLKAVFGISSFSEAVSVGSTVEEAFAEVVKSISFAGAKSFRVLCQRLDKSFVPNSPEFCRQLGSLIVAKTGLTVNLKEADVTVACEVIHNIIYLCTATTQCFAGLPVGTTGEVLVRAETQQDLLAGWFMLKRGCRLLVSCPETIDLSVLQHYSHGHILNRISLDHFSDASLRALLAVVSDTLTTLREYDVHCPVVRPLSGMDKVSIRVFVAEKLMFSS